MEFESPIRAYDAIKRSQKFFEAEVLNSKVKEEPLGKKDTQLLKMGISGLNWEFYWIQIFASNNETGSTIQIKGRLGIMQLFLASIIILLSGPFLYLAINNPGFFTIAITIVLFLIGVLSIIMPIIRLRSTIKHLKAILLTEDDYRPPDKK
jgi:hypothetical protein